MSGETVPADGQFDPAGDPPRDAIGDPPRSEVAAQALAVGLVALGAFTLRLLWDVGYWDTAVFQGAPAVLGLTHPTGYPTFLILGWLSINLLPMVTPAVAMNLLTAVAGAGAVSLVFVLARRLGAGGPAAAAGALTVGLMLSFWRTAVRADPHPLHVFLALSIVLLLLAWDRRADGRYLVAAALVFGLSMGNHLLTIMLAPGVGIFVLTVRPSILRQPRLILAALGALGLGMVVYLYIPIRAAANPPIHHDFAPTTLPLFLRYVLGQDFSGSMGFLSPSGPGIAAGQLGTFAQQLGDSLTPVVALGLGFLSLVGLWALLRDRRWRTAWLLGATGGLTLYARLTYANGDLERYAMYPMAVIGALAALGAQTLWDGLVAGPAVGRPVAEAQVDYEAQGSRRSRPSPVLVLAPALLLLVPAFLFSTNRDRIGIPSARCFVDDVAARVAPDAFIVSWWSMSTPLWYAQSVEGMRPDITIVNASSLAPDEVARVQPEGHPVYLIQSESDAQRVRDAGYPLRDEKFCGVDAWEVMGPAPAQTP